MKKKLIFCVYGLGIGGVEKCLVNLVNSLDPEIYDITIATMNPEYRFQNDINHNVKIITFEDQFINTTDTMPIIKNMSPSLAKIRLCFRYILYRIAVKFRIMPWKLQKPIKDEYDIAVAYSHVGHVPYYVIDRICAKKKILWYHTLWIDHSCEKYYRKFDKIIAVSKYCKKNFCKNFPELSGKVSVMYNLYDIEQIKELSKKEIDDINQKKLIVVTVARLSQEKGYRLAIKACELLKKDIGDMFCWYWIGSGSDYEKAVKIIDDLDLKDTFILMGNKLNPYPYIRQCDVYVQPSYSEAYCTAIVEAKVLDKAIVATNTGSTCEQIRDSVDGFICDKDSNEIAERIKVLIRNKELRQKFEQEHCLHYDTDDYINEYDKLFML